MRARDRPSASNFHFSMRDRRRAIYVRRIRAFAHRPEISFHREKKRGQLCRGRSGVTRAAPFHFESSRSRYATFGFFPPLVIHRRTCNMARVIGSFAVVPSAPFPHRNRKIDGRIRPRSQRNYRHSGITPPFHAFAEKSFIILFKEFQFHNCARYKARRENKQPNKTRFHLSMNLNEPHLQCRCAYSLSL